MGWNNSRSKSGFAVFGAGARDKERFLTLVQMAMGSRIDAEWKLRAPVEILELLNQECNPMFNH